MAQLPLEVRDGKWHHICITWTTRDGQWEAYQDGSKRGYGDNLAAWHPIKAGGVIILGQEQVQRCIHYAKNDLLKITNVVIFNFPVLKVTRAEDNLHIENLPTNRSIVVVLHPSIFDPYRMWWAGTSMRDRPLWAS